MGKHTDFSRKRMGAEAFRRKEWNRTVIADTLEQCKDRPVLRHVKRVRVCTLLGKQERSQSGVHTSIPQVQVRDADCVQMAMELCKVTGAKVWLLNMACPKKPGGGARSGCNAQEEHLCRCSNLLPQLEQSLGKYPLHTYKSSAGTTDFSVLVHPKVTFFKDPKDYSTLPPKDWSEFGVLTAAAEKVERGQSLGPNTHRFIDYLLEVAQMQECTHLVLSAWGCGAFHQDAFQVARSFKLALQRVQKKSIPEVVFAVMDDHNSDHNNEVFNLEFEQYDPLLMPSGSSGSKGKG
jgi:uncharacterized protein (TIGR02452 family)